MSAVYEVLDTFNYPHWHDQGSCRNPKYNMDWWLPISPQAKTKAIEICNECPVRKKCLEWILTIEQRDQKVSLGIFGGLTEKERRRIKWCYLKGCKKRPPRGLNFCTEEHAVLHRRSIHAKYRHN